MIFCLATNGRLPGPRAHAIATLRLGTALQRLGVSVEFWCPDRRGRAPEAVAPEPDAPTIVRLPCTDWIDRAPRWAQRANFARAFASEAERRRGEVAWFVLRDPVLWKRAARGRVRCSPAPRDERHECLARPCWGSVALR